MPILSDDRMQPAPSLLGDGSDGDVTIVGTVTLTREMFYNSLTVPAGAIVNAVYRVCVRKTLTNFGTIRNNGTSATTITGASAGTNAYVSNFQNGGGGGTNGANGTGAGTLTNVLSAAPTSRGGAGGNAGAFTGGAGGTSSSTITAAYAAPRNLLGYFALTRQVTPFNHATSGGGGAAAAIGDTGGGGGARGEVVILIADNIVNFGFIQANGGNGANAIAGSVNAGGGGGGGGGLVIVAARRIANFGTIEALGGNGGTKLGSGADGTAGTAGLVFQITSG